MLFFLAGNEGKRVDDDEHTERWLMLITSRVTRSLPVCLSAWKPEGKSLPPRPAGWVLE